MAGVHRPLNEEIERWDYDEDVQWEEFEQAAQAMRTKADLAKQRESVASRVSARSDLDSLTAATDDNDRLLLLPADDESSKAEAIATAIRAGIPIPSDVPASALLGGTIKRLGGKRARTVIGDDWTEDLDLPLGKLGSLQVQRPAEGAFPDSLAEVPGAAVAQSAPMSMETITPATFAARMKRANLDVPSTTVELDAFQDGGLDETDDWGAPSEEEMATIKVGKERPSPGPIPFPMSFSAASDQASTAITTTTAPMVTTATAVAAVADSEDDFEFPVEGAPLELSIRLAAPRTSTDLVDDLVEDWTDGSLGTRHGGARHHARSPRSSSVSAMSPSVSSSFTVESEDGCLDGLVLPDGPLHLGDKLKKRQEPPLTLTQVPALVAPAPAAPRPAPVSSSNIERSAMDQTRWTESDDDSEERSSNPDDFLSGIEIGPGETFDSTKLTVNRNVKQRSTRPTSPARRTAMTLTFTDKAQPSRIPRPVGAPERLGLTLESVSEVVVPATTRPPPPPAGERRAPSRLGGPPPTMTASMSSIPLPSTPSRAAAMSSSSSSSVVAAATTPGRARDLRGRPSMVSLKPEPTTTSAQLLKMKRSMPAMRATTASSHHHHHSGSKPSSTAVPPPLPAPTRAEGNNNGRGGIPSRSKTPVDRAEPGWSQTTMMRRLQVPFLPPSNTAEARSHHISTKTARTVRRHDSESSINSADIPTRSTSRAGAVGASSRFAQRSTSPPRKDVAPESLAREAAAKRTLVRPTKRRFFGDGSELEIFDDLPTSASVESQFVKPAVGRGLPKVMTRGKSVIVPTTTIVSAPDDRTNATTMMTTTTTMMTATTPALSTMVPLGSLAKLDEGRPRFARDTQASRIAREQRTAAMGGMHPMTTAATFGSGWKTQMAMRAAIGGNMGPTTTTATTTTSSTRLRRRRHKAVQQKPHLIKPLGDTHQNPKSENGMHYNPELFRWEGNENALVPFEADRPTPASSSSVSARARAIIGSSSAGPEFSLKTEVTTHQGGGSISSSNNHIHQPTPVQRPALITNFGTTSPSVQVVGGMVFDPRKMCWLKLSQYPNHPHHPTYASNQQQPLSPSVTSSAAAAMACMDDDEEDPFAGIADLVEKPISSSVVGGRLGSGVAASFVSGPGHDATASSSNSPTIGGPGSTATGVVGRPRAATASGQDEWLVGEEFDVGPEWVRRQRDEEVRWTRRFGDWGNSTRTDEWKWAIQKVALSTIIPRPLS